jgi:hypothetical protein
MPWRHTGSWYVDPYYLDLGNRWRRVVSFTPRPLYPRGENPRYPLDRRLGGPQGRSGRHGEVKIIVPTGTRIRSLGRLACSQSLYRLHYPGFWLCRRMFYDVASNTKAIYPRMVWGIFTKIWARFWRETVVAYFKVAHYCNISLETDKLQAVELV